MSREMDSDELPLTRQLIVGVACAIMLPVFLLFRHFGRIDLALPASVYVGMIWLAVAVYWNLRNRFWFWTVIAFVLGLHAWALTRFAWQAFMVNRITLLPIGLADFLVIVGIIQLAQKLFPRRAH